MPTLPTREEALAALKVQPGIDITKQKEGTKIIVETNNHLFEIKVLSPKEGLIEVSSTSPELKRPTIGQYMRGVYVLDSAVTIDRWIGRTMQMYLRFRNGFFLSGPVVSATISGEGWKYEIF